MARQEGRRACCDYRAAGPFFSQLKNGIFSHVVLCHQGALWASQSWGAICFMQNKDMAKIICIPPWSRDMALSSRVPEKEVPFHPRHNRTPRSTTSPVTSALEPTWPSNSRHWTQAQKGQPCTASQVKMEDFNSDHIPCGPNRSCTGGSQQPSLPGKGDTLHPTPNPELHGSHSGTLAVPLEGGLTSLTSASLSFKGD